MSEIKMDLRTKKDIIGQIRELSKSYTPEWRFDEENPDIGTALAMVYADLLLKNINLFNRLLEKNKITFFNRLNAGMLPGKASEGYVTFQLVNTQAPGVEAEAGTRVFAELKEEDRTEISVPPKVYFETMEDVYVTPARISHIIQVSDEEDYISRDYDDTEHPNIALFDFTGQNRQNHRLCVTHEDICNLREEGELRIRFLKNYLNNISEELANSFADREKVKITYCSEDGFEEFEDQWTKDGVLFLKKGKNQPMFKKPDIYFEIKDITPFLGFSCEGIFLSSSGHGILPTAIYGAGIQCSRTEYMPFGRQMGIYREVNFASDEALSKKGAQVCLKFKLDFVKTPLDTNTEKEINWRRIMKPADLKPEPEYDITIEEVIWEYYNGKGWHRLFENREYQDVFTVKNGLYNQFREIRFTCPKDISYLELDSVGSYYIRARILVMNNEYKMNGYYVTPMLSETIFDYEYKEEQSPPQHIVTYNNMESETLKGFEIGESNRLTPFGQTSTPYPSVYLGFQQAPSGGPVKILFTMEAVKTEKPLPLKWEYYARDRWKNINVTDETEQFRKTGIVTITGGNDFQRKRLFGKELFWIRVSDENGYYRQHSGEKRPVVTGIHINSVKALAVQSTETEYFRMKEYQENQEFGLKKTGILTSWLWVCEGEEASDWIVWKSVDSFENSLPNDRHYVVDSGSGTLFFGNGRNGKVPPISARNNIKIIYKTGGGSYTNVKAKRIDKMEKSIGFISKAVNYEDFLGGCDRETPEHSLKRNAALLRHQNRALTLKDFEELALEASHDIAKVACFTGYNERGEKEKGCVTLAVLQKNPEKGFLHFHNIKETINTYLKSRMSPLLSENNLLRITEPRLVEINTNVSLMVKNFHDIFAVKRQVIKTLDQFFDPLAGNFNQTGWEIGEFPRPDRIRNLLAGIPDIFLLQQISFTYYIRTGTGKAETDREYIEKSPFVLPVNGKHQVFVTVRGD